MRVLFFNEGNLGTHIMGQGQLQTALTLGVHDRPDVQARFAGLAPMGRFEGALAHRRLRPLADSGLDLHTLRWHLVQSIRARRVLERELMGWHADAVHVHTQSVALAMGHVMRRVPVALSVDTTIRDWRGMPAWRADRSGPSLPPAVALERRAFHNAALVLAWTEWARAAVEAAAPRTRVVEHHPGIDLERYTPAPRRERPRPRVLFVGGRFAEKGGHTLLAALGERLGRELDLDLVTPSANIPQRPGVRVHHLAPSSPQLLDLQQQADLFCLPTRGDAAPWAVLEAMACGTPVVSTRVGGIPGMLDHGRAGVLLEPGDEHALGEAVFSLLGDRERRAALAARARALCEERYDARRQFERLAGHLAEATAGHQARAARPAKAAHRAQAPAGQEAKATHQAKAPAGQQARTHQAEATHPGEAADG